MLAQEVAGFHTSEILNHRRKRRPTYSRWRFVRGSFLGDGRRGRMEIAGASAGHRLLTRTARIGEAHGS